MLSSPEASLQTAHFELVADIDRTHWWFLGRQVIVRELLAVFLPSSRRKTVVDVGCGPGATIASLADCYCCVGIDQSTDAIRLARERFPTVTFIRGEAPRDVLAAVDSVSAFLLMDVIEHCADDQAVVAGLVEALPVGGLLVLTVPAGMALWSEQDEHIGHYRRYSPDSLRSVWADLPVQELLLSHFNSRLYAPILLIRQLSRFVGRSFGEEGSDMRASSGWTNRVLFRVFAGETRRLGRLALGQSNTRPYPVGVSLVAVLRRLPEEP